MHGLFDWFAACIKQNRMTMDVMAGVGGMMGQLAVGIAGGDQTGAVMMASKMQMMKTSNIDSLPDKVSLLKISIIIIRLQYYT